VSELVFHVADLVDRPGEHRRDTGRLPLDITVGESHVGGVAEVAIDFHGIDGGVLARFDVVAPVHLVCTRCLTEWDSTLEVGADQVFEREEDEDGYALGRDDTVDLSGPVRDEVALAVPVRPLCRPDCAGLCPTCGTDLNKEPCGGHDEPSSSPFAALQGMFDSPDH
jgi:uncharacterized protein